MSGLAPVSMSRAGQIAPVQELALRLAATGEGRLVTALIAAARHLHALVEETRPTPAELRHAIDFLTDVGHAADARRQEWVLLADVLGLSTLVEDINADRPAGATPNTLAGPFYRADVPHTPNGANLSRDGKGDPLLVTGRITDLDGAPVPVAQVEVWQANGEGVYENQEPDRQPEFNLRGRLCCDASGAFSYRTVRPRGYLLPEDGPVGRLLTGLGYRLERPAHLHFRVTAAGFDTLTTHVFDRTDPAIGRDAIFGVKPALLADFAPSGGTGPATLSITFVLTRPAPSPHPPA